jgi:hypothetical protein
MISGYLPLPPGVVTPTFAIASYDTNFIYNPATDTATNNSGSFFFREMYSLPGGPSVTDSMTGAITWIRATEDSGTATIHGTGTVLTSAGSDPFEIDFPVGGMFDIDTEYLTASQGGLIYGTGSVSPIAAVPAPAIGTGWLAGLLSFGDALFQEIPQMLIRDGLTPECVSHRRDASYPGTLSIAAPPVWRLGTHAELARS